MRKKYSPDYRYILKYGYEPEEGWYFQNTYDDGEFDQMAKEVIDRINFSDFMTGKKVWLYKYGGLENPVIISCNPYHIKRHFEGSEQKHNNFHNHTIREYPDFQSAYKGAAQMMKKHKLYKRKNLK